MQIRHENHGDVVTEQHFHISKLILFFSNIIFFLIFWVNTHVAGVNQNERTSFVFFGAPAQVSKNDWDPHKVYF